jgi:hypothetical protein
VITAVNDRGETVKSNEVSQVTTGNASTVQFNWGAVAGATAYKVYLTNGAAGTEDRFIVGLSTNTILSTWPPGAQMGVPPTVNGAIVSVTKTFEKPNWIDGFRFAVYGGITCKGPGFDMSEAETKTVAAFLASESVGVERAMMKTRFVVNGTSWPAPTDLTPAGGAVTPAQGLAMLEGDASCKYAGAPIIHMARGVASLLAGQQGSIHRGQR